MIRQGGPTADDVDQLAAELLPWIVMPTDASTDVPWSSAELGAFAEAGGRREGLAAARQLRARHIAAAILLRPRVMGRCDHEDSEAAGSFPDLDEAIGALAAHLAAKLEQFAYRVDTVFGAGDVLATGTADHVAAAFGQEMHAAARYDDAGRRLWEAYVKAVQAVRD